MENNILDDFDDLLDDVYTDEEQQIYDHGFRDGIDKASAISIRNIFITMILLIIIGMLVQMGVI